MAFDAEAYRQSIGAAIQQFTRKHRRDRQYGKRPADSFKDRVKAAAHGNWPSILAALGVPEPALRGRNGPCPGCGGKDRFQYTTKGHGAAWGRWSCRSHTKGGGDGFALVMHVKGCSFPDALRMVAHVLGISEGGQ